VLLHPPPDASATLFERSWDRIASLRHKRGTALAADVFARLVAARWVGAPSLGFVVCCLYLDIQARGWPCLALSNEMLRHALEELV